MNENLEINKGVELMLRRKIKKEPERFGLKISKKFIFLKRKFEIKFEFTWEDKNPSREN
jgi:hypothetical protein